MSGECDNCDEHCLDCKCEENVFPSLPSLIKIVSDPPFETYLREDGNIGVRPNKRFLDQNYLLSKIQKLEEEVKELKDKIGKKK